MGKLDNVVVVDLDAMYCGEPVKLIRHYPDINAYAYHKTNMGGYGFMRDSVVEIVDE